MPVAPISGGPSGSIGRAPFHSCTAAPVLASCAAPGNQSWSTFYRVWIDEARLACGVPPISALPATRTRLPSREIATL
jgi:hypothetical protein